MVDTSPACPCGFGDTYDACCGRLHRGEAAAASAEQLMRSRYSAFAVRDQAYLLRSWHPSTRPDDAATDPVRRWTRLEVLERTGGGFLDQEGTVAFRAHSERRGVVEVQSENSRFARDDGRWTYVGPA